MLTERLSKERRTANAPANRTQRCHRCSISHMQPVVDQLRALEDTRRDGTIALPDGTRIGVTNLAKLFWPKLKLTKGDLLRYYATVAPLILPVVADRPLVMKRFPNGVDDRVAVLSAAQAEGTAAGRRAHGGAARRSRPDRGARRRALHRRIAHHAALHDAARRDLAGPVVLARAVAARRRLRGDRSRSGRGRHARAGARRRALGPRRARVDASAGRAEDVRLARAAHLHSRCRRARRTSRGSSSVRSSPP